MPSQPVWFSRLPSILEELRAHDSDYLDRHALERIFGVRERRARQLMVGLSTLRVGNAVAVSRRSLIASLDPLNDGAAALELAKDAVAPTTGGAVASRDSTGEDRLATPSVDRLPRAHEEAQSASRGPLKQRYEEFCRAMVKQHLMTLPQAVRSRRFEETRSAIRRQVPQLRRNELDEMAQRELELKIRAELHLPSIEEFTASCV
jgi:hypothetical protein